MSFNPFNHFWLFLGAVWVHAITLAAGCVVTVVINLLEKYVIKKTLGWKVDLAILLAFVFFACFQAWRDQYEVAVKVNQNPSIQITNNVPPAPAPIINSPPQTAYMKAGDPIVVLGSYKLGGNWAVSVQCQNTSPTVIAQDALCQDGLRVVKTVPNAFKQAVVNKSIEDAAYLDFRKELEKVTPPGRNFGPGDYGVTTVYTPPIVPRLDEAFRFGKKTIIFLADFNWKDGTGEHHNEVCAWLQINPELFSGPGSFSPNPQFVFHYCQEHNGVRK